MVTVNLSDLKSERKLIKDIIAIIGNKDYSLAKDKLEEAQKVFHTQDCCEGISICLSLTALVNYLIDNNNLNTSLETLQDSGYLADYSKNPSAKLFNEMVLANINYSEGNLDVALRHYKNAMNAGINNDEYEMLGFVVSRMKQIRDGVEFTFPTKSDPLVSLVKIGRSITAQTDINVLLRVIAEETKVAMQADRCTVFLLDKKAMNYGQKLPSV